MKALSLSISVVVVALMISSDSLAADSTVTRDLNLGIGIRGQRDFQLYDFSTELYTLDGKSPRQLRQKIFGASWLKSGDVAQLSSNFIVDFVTLVTFAIDSTGTLFMLTHAPNTAIAYPLDRGGKLNCFLGITSDYYLVPVKERAQKKYQYGIVFSPSGGLDFKSGRTLLRMSAGYDYFLRFDREQGRLGWQIGAALLFTDIVANSP